MRLRNKKTGEIIEFDAILPVKDVAGDSVAHLEYGSLAELNEEWEDYEEPKRKHWYMTSWGEVWQYGDDPLHEEWRITLGNDFETKEEAEQAVRKLKAWKRLKDFGCGFMLDDHCAVKFVGPDARKITSAEEQRSLSDAYKLLFGGEE